MLPIPNQRKVDRERAALLLEAKLRPRAPSPPHRQFKFVRLPHPPLVSFGTVGETRQKLKETGASEGSLGDGESKGTKSDQVVLVPIKLEFDFDTAGFRLRDQFLWNLNETEISPEAYAQQLCGDFRLPSLAVQEIAKAIKDQLDEFYDHSYIRPQVGSQGILDTQIMPPIRSLAEKPAETSSIPQEDVFHIDDHPNLRVTLKIDVSIGNVTVVDAVEWDINCSRNSPEVFAENLCSELGLPAVFRVAITIQLRDQIQMYQKSLFVLEHPFDDSQIDDEDLWYNHFLPPVTEVLRSADQVEDLSPTILVGALPPVQAQAPIEDKSGAARRRRLMATRARGRNVLPERREVTRLTMTPLPVWKNGVKKPPIPTARTSQQIAAAALLGKRRTRQDAQLEEEEAFRGEGVVGAAKLDVGDLAGLKQKAIADWKCVNCNVGILYAGLMRDGPSGKRTLCDACGLWYARNGSMREKILPEAAVEGKDQRSWFKYPQPESSQ
ncbi:SWI/SNF chromatin-remodeling complex subunit [Entophlyctis luteolus]|nr:SWI/SNF chromatin-remodeling complex subunit [Entophlyctis luteolus]